MIHLKLDLCSVGGKRALQRKLENAVTYTVRPTVHTTRIRHENRDFRKRYSNKRILKTPALSFRVDGKHFENVLRKRASFLQTRSQSPRAFWSAPRHGALE